MTSTPTTYDLAAKQIKAYVQPLRQGALAMPFSVRDEDGRLLSLSDDQISGGYLLLAFLNNRETAAPVLRKLAEAQAALDQNSISVIAICADSHATRNRELKRATRFNGPMLGDSTGAVFASYGLHKGHDVDCRIVVLTPFRQIRTWFDSPLDDPTLVQNIMTATNDNSSDTTSDKVPSWAPFHAPVLIVPNVLSPEECSQLIAICEDDSPFSVRPPRANEFSGDYKIPVYEHNRQDRFDHIIKNPQTLAFLDERIFGRVTPMVKKSFGFDVTHREDLHIARYQGERSGNQMGHRDNTSAATAYRRFALSLNLNDDYAGGEVMFKEFSQQGYKSPAGSALVFSSALLHEVLETTEGVRYTLISHFFNQQTVNQ